MENKALGKGLSALIPEKSEIDNSEKVLYIEMHLIRDNKLQPRSNYDPSKLEELKKSIKEKGVLQPILVRTKDSGYEVVAGERRLKAARDLKLEKIPAIVKSLTDQEALVIALIENIQREELNPIEEALAYRRLTEEFNFTQEKIAQSVGKDRTTITNLLRILNLPEHIQQSVYNGQLTVGHARTLLSVDSQNEKNRLFELAVKKTLSVRELENLVKALTGGGNRREKQKTTRSYEIIALEEDLQKALGTKVRIIASKKRGKIIVEYYSLDDLDRVIQLIKK